MPAFWIIVNQVIREAELLIEVLDARMINETRNSEIEQKIKQAGKKLLYVINKCDLVNKKKLGEIKKELQLSVFVSSKDKLGTTILKQKILEVSHGQPIVVGILGYPNVGKSSLINALAGRKAARTSSTSGFTHAVQKIRVDNKITLLDTPGVYPFKEKNEEKQALTGTLSFNKIKNSELMALKLINEKKELLKNFYAVSGEEAEEILENIGRKLKKLRQGGQVDLEAVSRMVLRDWQTGKIREE
jgi:ribosome biogenesis GTPase A